MNIVLLQTGLSEEEIRALINEFPGFLFLAPGETAYKKLGKEEWNSIEVVYGADLSARELSIAPALRWIHAPTPNLSALCLDEVEKRGNILVTCTKEENIYQIAEYVIGAVLAFAKNLFRWERTDRAPGAVWLSKCRESMWTLQGRVFLQIGLGKIGSEIAKRAQQMDLRVWGVQEPRSFHPHCNKVFSLGELHSVLPAADVVSVILPQGKQKGPLLKRETLELMKNDAILIVMGSKMDIDEEALAEVASTGKFRGILWDVSYKTPLSPNSKLWKTPHLIITPEVGPLPKSVEKTAFHLFRFNLRQYQHGNFSDMRNVVGKKGLI